MYLGALCDGLSPIPQVPSEVRDSIQALPNEEIYAKLQEVDAAIAIRLKPSDTQRLRRAYEVWLATGRPMSYWQDLPKQPLFPQAEWVRETLNPPREELYARCDARFVKMLEQGAIEEVKTLLSQNYPASAPIMKAVGVPEIRSYLCGEISLAEATAKAQQATRRYAKRQTTWLRNQLR
jgi:tRNA dimethylallyltransferase